MEVACKCCAAAVEHKVEWSVHDGIAAVETKCSACGATGRASILESDYRPPHLRGAAKAAKITMYKATIAALSHAKIEK